MTPGRTSRQALLLLLIQPFEPLLMRFGDRRPPELGPRVTDWDVVVPAGQARRMRRPVPGLTEVSIRKEFESLFERDTICRRCCDKPKRRIAAVTPKESMFPWLDAAVTRSEPAVQKYSH